MSDAAQPPVQGKVLVVDDNLQNLELLEAYMEDVGGLTTLRATGGEEALQQVAQHHPDVVLLDIMMPRMSGFEVCKKLKSDPATRDIAVIMVTALNETADIERSVECGADDFLSKPVNRNELVARVQRMIRDRRRTIDSRGLAGP
ncbi:MAG: response regulator [Phycisphaerae bacterium]|nr:response regulator [Phycisphaerae bacterium]